MVSKETKLRQSWITDTRGLLRASSVLTVGKRTRTVEVGAAATISSAGTAATGGVPTISLCRLKNEN